MLSDQRQLLGVRPILMRRAVLFGHELDKLLGRHRFALPVRQRQGEAWKRKELSQRHRISGLWPRQVRRDALQHNRHVLYLALRHKPD